MLSTGKQLRDHPVPRRESVVGGVSERTCSRHIPGTAELTLEAMFAGLEPSEVFQLHHGLQRSRKTHAEAENQAVDFLKTTYTSVPFGKCDP